MGAQTVSMRSANLDAWKTSNIAFAGLLAGIVSRTMTAPAERLKILLATGKLDSISKGITDLVQRQGLRSLWRGNFANCLKIGPGKAIKFATYEHCLRACCANPARPTWLESFLAASSVGAVIVTLMHPLDTIKTQLAAGRNPPNIVGLAKKILHTQGARGFMVGLAPSILSTVPFLGVSMGTFTFAKTCYNDTMGLDPLLKPPTSVLLGCGVLSTISAELISYPLYCIKTNIQSGKGHGVIDSARQILARAGGNPLALYNGMGVAALKSLPSAGITFTVYENAKATMGL